MNTLAQANIFFIITSIATVIVTALIVAILVYVLRIVRIVDKTTKELSEKIHSAEKSISRLNSQVISEKIIAFLTALFFSKKKMNFIPLMKKNENNNVEVAVAIGVGALAAGALGYFLAGPNGKKHRKDVKSWMVKFQGDLMEKLEDAKEVTAPMYAQIVDEVGARYKGLKNIDPVELANEIALLKKRWDSLAKNKKAAKKAVKKIAKKAVKKVATKVVKKVAAK